MSFRGRLTLFFLLIGVLPMVVIAVLASRTADEAATGKADARLFAGLETATGLYEEAARKGREAAEAIGTDAALGAAVESEDAAAAQAAAAGLAAANDVESLVLRSSGGEELASVGASAPFAPAELQLTGAGGARAAELIVSVTDGGAYVAEVEKLTGRRAALYVDGQPSVTVSGEESVPVPAQGGADVTVNGKEQRVLTGDLPDEQGQRIALFGPVEEGGVVASNPAVALALVALLGVALLFVLSIRRTLSAQIKAMLDAARRIGGGDFSHKVLVIGNERDEMAGLATEFNRMSDQLAGQMAQLRSQQVEIDRSVRRIGEASASGLDRDGLLKIVAETAVSACRADCGLIALTGRGGVEVSAGAESEQLADAIMAAEDKASKADELVAVGDSGVHALSAPLHLIADPDQNLGVMSIARVGAAFTDAEGDVFRYLIGQASSSIENVALHEMVSEQAVTDELTGLANNRAFRDVADKEAARARRFSHALSLVMLDIDDFKKVNDTYGHLQGDEVLRRIGAILRAESRGIDEPARYGGEEFVVALPETDAQGAVELAERVRTRIEAEEVPFVEREGILRITASLGVATIPDSAADVRSLIAAADGALYAAKRGGKNRVEVAPA
ncbi:MAG: diguanylate cyclase [Solirubrobacterales bacterium]